MCRLTRFPFFPLFFPPSPPFPCQGNVKNSNVMSCRGCHPHCSFSRQSLFFSLPFPFSLSLFSFTAFGEGYPKCECRLCHCSPPLTFQLFPFLSFFFWFLPGRNRRWDVSANSVSLPPEVFFSCPPPYYELGKISAHNVACFSSASPFFFLPPSRVWRNFDNTDCSLAIQRFPFSFSPRARRFHGHDVDGWRWETTIVSSAVTLSHFSPCSEPSFFPFFFFPPPHSDFQRRSTLATSVDRRADFSLLRFHLFLSENETGLQGRRRRILGLLFSIPLFLFSFLDNGP